MLLLSILQIYTGRIFEKVRKYKVFLVNVKEISHKKSIYTQKREAKS